MIFIFEKKVDCPKNCFKSFQEQVQKLTPAFKAGINGHCSITHFHKPKKHLFFVTYYDKGVHEDSILVKKKRQSHMTKFNEFQEKYTGVLPSLDELKKLV